MTGHRIRLLAVAATLLVLGGCSALQDGEILKPEFWASSPLKDNTEAELGLGEMAKGDNVKAMTHFQKALKANPNDVDALLGFGLLYKNTGQKTKARQMFEAVLALRPDDNKQMLVWADRQPQPISKIASVNLGLLDGAPPPEAHAVSGDGSGTDGEAMASKPPVQSAMGTMSDSSSQPFVEADSNVERRFKILRDLLDQGLITKDEFIARRQANVGALLPLTSPPPAAGLDRPVPSAEQISGRLRAIGRALEMRAMSVAQHTAERTMILDALMPATPVAIANPGEPPQGLMQAADAVRRLEKLKEEHLITSDEYTKERAAIERAMQPAPMKPTTSKAPSAQNGGEPAALKGFRPGVHLASYRSKRAADIGWRKLLKSDARLLRGLSHHVERVDLGGRKGIYYRLKAGPLKNNDAAKALCRKFKARRQYCVPTMINFG
ncbi:tetratricopeptide repeat protein [Varunaivibrio sulfuroxidans]|uniref:Putative oligomerization/nucleic acid binding protein n=1 Tax=Varunaivibrio sulfuroxidans TaxID=1773489 RepID=A0A4R3JBZ2_9PROT|nr:tetratricopeptide repeat protein [Varunaivibrio sulfuroxidans]TCS63167.1 putative oligomerization/nucleic acid binding protein [Varunaivibrio sulfuroxidans]WES31771.1 tetratricopeptide repeat protein [Varunaivibrio sulfuroxidans]